VSRSAWRQAKLGDLVQIQRDAVSPEAIAHGTLFVGLENISGDDGTVSYRTVEAGELGSSKFRFGPAHILYGKLRPNLRKIGRPTGEGVCSTDILPLQPGAEIDRDYLFHYLRSPEMVQLAVTRTPTANLPRLSPRTLATFPMRFPPLPEQRRIAAILDKADAVRRKRQQTLVLADQFLRSAFLDMFGDPVTNPKGWDIVSLLEVSTRVTDGTHQPPAWTESGIPFLFVSNIRDGKISFDTQKFISQDTWEELTRRCPIEPTDILYTTVGSYGNAAIVATNRRFAFQRHIAHIKPDARRVHPEYLVALLESHAVRRQADEAVRGVAQKTLNLEDLKRFRILLPPVTEQERYVRLRRRGLAHAAASKAAVASGETLLSTLVQRAFRGEL
jgi:type I restriction enzyme S subunit